MELKILSPQEDGFVKEIQWNHEEIKAEVAEKMKEYRTLVYTEDTIRMAKDDRATLNKFRTALDNERKKIKKQCMAPYEAFEAQVKDIIAIVDEPIQLIDSQIKEVEERKRAEKKGKIFDYYEEHIGTLKAVLPFDKLFRPEYLNASKTMKSITAEMQEAMARVNADLDTIEGFGSKYELQIKDVYLKTLNLSEAMREKARLEEIEKRLEERRAEEQQRKQREEQRQREAEQVRSVEQKQPEAVSDKEPVREEEKEQPEEEPRFTIDFRVTATRAELELIKGFFRNYNITYGPVPKKGE